MAILSSDNTEVNFNFGGNLSIWQVQGICNGRSNNEIRRYLEENENDGWNEEAIEEFINFKNSDLFNEMFS